jgi:hypothetical protein
MGLGKSEIVMAVMFGHGGERPWSGAVNVNVSLVDSVLFGVVLGCDENVIWGWCGSCLETLR